MLTAKEIKYLLLNRLLTSLIYHLFSLYSRTLRVQYFGVEDIQRYLDSGGRIVFASWHQRFFGGFSLPKVFRRSPCIMISQSRDGDFIARIVQRVGWNPVRGSSSRGGRNALAKMIREITAHGIGVHIVDGPNGPPQIIKPGLISLAQRTGAAICAGFVSYENAWKFNSWDRFMVPKPFSKILVQFGPLIFVPAEMDENHFDAFRRELEVKLTAGYAATDKFWKE